MPKETKKKVYGLVRELAIFGGLIFIPIFAFDVALSLIFLKYDIWGLRSFAESQAVKHFSIIWITAMTLFVIPLIFRKRFKENFWKINFPKKEHYLADGAFVFSTYLILGVLLIVLGVLLGIFKITGWAWDGLSAVDYAKHTGYVFYLFLNVALVEEMVFRGYLQNSLARMFKSKVLPLILATAVFATSHLPILLFRGLKLSDFIESFVGIFIAGLFLGYFYFRTKSLVTPIVLHFAENFTGLLLLSIYNASIEPNWQDISGKFTVGPKISVDGSQLLLVGILGLLFNLLFFLILHLYFNSRGYKRF